MKNRNLALTEKANSLGELGNYTQVIAYYDKILAIYPENIEAIASKKNLLLL